MAIVNTLEHCLNSPYLSRDPQAPARVSSLLKLAADRLQAANDLKDAPKSDPADVCLLSYEAMFACVRALVYVKGYREAGLRCLLIACDVLYVRSGLLEPEHIHAFERIQSLKASPAESIEAASRLVQRTIELLPSPNGQVPQGVSSPQPS